MSDSLAMVLGMGPTSLAVVRELGRHGVEVFGIGLYPSEVSLQSRYCKGLGACDPRDKPHLLLNKLVAFALEIPKT